ncbi:hypothetical protein [Candidatus Spongiihabitans sp.]|uniref:hypothetical protein n=1 Tax=Candidatus Spongiihabitans sp. TaxID=3101308 RepID=UPI003C7DDD59
MSEAMTVELIVESEWMLKKYWTKPRFAYQTKSSGWSDVDVLSYHPETKHLVISESKVRGRKKAIHAYTEHTKEKHGTILEYKPAYFSFIPNLPKICSDGVVFTKFSKMVKTITVQVVSNCVIDKSLKNEAESSVLEEIEKYMPSSKAKIEVTLDSTMDVISRVIEAENKHNQGRRYGHPMLDIAREINRYFYPNVGGAGKTKDKTEAVKKQAIQPFLQAIHHQEILGN